MDAIDRAEFDLIVIDEYNHYKNAQTRRWKAMNKLVKANTWLWGLTGSPASQSPTDAYGLAKLMNPSSVPKFYNAFRDDVMLKVTQFKYVPRQNAMDMVFKVLQPAIRYTKEECLDLPPRMYITREVPMSAQQKKYYKLLKEQMIIEAAGEEISTANAAVNLSKLLQIASGNAYSDNKEVIEFDCSNRQEALLDIIEEASKKVIVFATFKHTIAMLEGLLSRNNISYGVIQGGVSLSKRSALVDEFQNTPEPRVLILQPKSASHGITLTGANVVVWWSPTASSDTYLQANDRVHRAGQDAPCTVIRLCGSPVEERFYKTLEHKGNLLDDLLGLYKDVLTL
jgi:SNF2 family DNA or RNA helicase